MRIGFDVSPLGPVPHSSGIVRATRGLVEALERRGELEIVRLSCAARARGPATIAWRQWRLPREALRERVDGIHSMLSAIPFFAGVPRVQTIHELPWLHGVHENAGVAARFWASAGAQRAEAIVTASELVARELRSATRQPRIVVIPWGVDERFVALAGDANPAERGDVLLPGGARPKKNAELALRALALLASATRPRLSITGPASDADRDRLTNAARALGVEGSLHFAGELDDAQLARAYRGARATLALARSEGFGFPVVESLACGTPVIVAAGTVQAEIAGVVGDAVALEDASALAAAIERAASASSSGRERLRARAAEFTWDRAAQRVESLWREILA